MLLPQTHYASLFPLSPTPLIKPFLSTFFPSFPTYRSGHITLGSTPNASAIKCSPLGHGRVSAFASVEELNPDARDSAASDVPFLRKPAMMSAGCHPVFMILSINPDNDSCKLAE
jgi:hypothetical protein